MMYAVPVYTKKSVAPTVDTLLLSSGVEIPPEDLKAAFPFPWAFLVGWVVLALSYFTPIDGSLSIQVTWSAMAAAAVSLVLGWIASVPMGDAVMTRNAKKKTMLGLAFVSSWLVLTIVSGWGELTPTHASLRAAGAISIIASMKILWKFRKMGDDWEQKGTPNPDPIVYNMGGPLFIFGWFLFWVGAASTHIIDQGVDAKGVLAVGLPIYFTSRTAVAFIAGCGMVPIVMLIDYAHDEGAEWLGFGTDGRFFGRFLESPIPFLTAWTLFGLASWLPLGADGAISPLQWTILANCVVQGIVAGLLIQTALYKGDLQGKQRWSIPFVFLFLALAAELGYFTSGGNGRLWLSLPGAILIILGQKTVFGDRKRGDHWMETQVVNPTPIVYSWGEPFFMSGWIILSLVMAMPM